MMELVWMLLMCFGVAAIGVTVFDLLKSKNDDTTINK